MEKQVCRICGKEKDLENFSNSFSRRKSGLVMTGKRTECKICAWERRKSYYNKDPRTGILMNIKQRVRLNKNIEFNLILDDIIIPEFCPILEIPLKRGTKGKYWNSPTADRINNNKGYIKGNIRIISMQANKMKNNATKEELILFAKNIIKYLNDDIV